MLVIKLGGSKGINREAFCKDLASLVHEGRKVVVVHGASHETNLLCQRLGKEIKFVNSPSGYESRFTDRETLEIFQMAYVGKVNKSLVERLQQLGINALGLSGIDGRLLEGARKSSIKVVEEGKRKILRGDYTGKVEKVNGKLLDLLLREGYTPVITPPALSYEREAINVDGDRAAAAIASSLEAEKLIILSNVPGLLKDLEDESSLIRHIKKEEADLYMNYAKGRMKRKLLGALEAMGKGVKEVIFADGRVENPIKRALEGYGTIIR